MRPTDVSHAVGTRTARTDEELLASHETDDFGVFYDRHVRALLGYFQRRTGDPQVAADLTAETFASAIVAQERYVATGAPALAWLYAHRLAAARRLPAARGGRAPDAARALDGAPAAERGGRGDDPAARRRRRRLGCSPSCRATSARRSPRTSSTTQSYAELAASRQHLRGRGPPARLARARHAAPPDGRALMSDFVTELRREVVGAHAQHRVGGGPHAPPPPAAGPRRRRRARGAARRRRVDRALDPAARAERRAARGRRSSGSAAIPPTGCSPPARCGSPTPGRARSSASIPARGR